MADDINGFFYEQLSAWDDARQRFANLEKVSTREIVVDGFTLTIQYNPTRIVSTSANISKQALEKRQCFLCDKNRPSCQTTKVVDDDFVLLVNPFPIMPKHYTIPLRRHEPQLIAGRYSEMLKLLILYPDLTVFYNGPRCGASAPDHMHLQAVDGGLLPIQTQWQQLCKTIEKLTSTGCDNADKDTFANGIYHISGYPFAAFLLYSDNELTGGELFSALYDAMTEMTETDEEPMMNIVAWRENKAFVSIVFPRRNHRPACYYATDDSQRLISPGALDMAGLVITPREADYKRVNSEEIKQIFAEVSYTNTDVDTLKIKLKNKK